MKIDSFLIINPFGIGDVLFSTPLLRNLKEHFPHARLSYLCNKRTEDIIANHPLISKTFVYERDEFKNIKKNSNIAWLKKGIEFINEIREERIDIALDLSLNTQFGFFSWAAGIKKRFGLDYKGRGRFLTHKIKIDGFDNKHVAEYYLDLLGLLKIPYKRNRLEVYANKENKESADNFIRNNSLSDKDCIIGIAPCGGETLGNNAFMKRWDGEKFASLINLLISELQAKVFLFAGPKEKNDLGRIFNALSVKDNVYEFTNCSLGEVVALIEKCSLFIGNDTGTLRFADALGKKTIALFGPVSDKVYGLYPYDSENQVVFKRDVPCRPCYKKFRMPPCPYGIKCLRDIPVGEVFDAAKKLLNE